MITVLLVDDEPMILKVLLMQLRRHRPKWRCVTAKSGEEALAVMATCNFDVVLSDMRMPGINGAELLGRVRARRPETARIVLSGHAERAAVEQALEVAHAFLSKPISSEALITCIERVRAAIDAAADGRGTSPSG
jgi:YesN/AraC family two-component response regulator